VTFICGVLVFAAAAHAQSPFGITSEDFGSARPAKIAYESSGDFQKPLGVTYAGWSCGANGCLFFGFPMTQYGYNYTAVFSYGDWRIAAWCSSDNPGWSMCALPKASTEAWIELRKGDKDLTVLFPKKKAPKDLEKSMHSRFLPIIYHIASVHNVKTNESWPKTIEDVMRK